MKVIDEKVSRRSWIETLKLLGGLNLLLLEAVIVRGLDVGKSIVSALEPGIFVTRIVSVMDA